MYISLWLCVYVCLYCMWCRRVLQRKSQLDVWRYRKGFITRNRLACLRRLASPTSAVWADSLETQESWRHRRNLKAVSWTIPSCSSCKAFYSTRAFN